MGLIALLFSVLLDAIRPLHGRTRSTRYGEEDDEDGYGSTVSDPLDPFDPFDPLPPTDVRNDAPFDHLTDAAAGLAPDPAAGLAGLAGAPPEPAPRQSPTGPAGRPVPGSAASAADAVGAPHPLQRHALRLIDWMSSDEADSSVAPGRHLSAPGWVAAVGIPVVLVALAEAILEIPGGFFVFLLHVFVLYLTVGLGGFHSRLLELQLLIGAGEERLARSVLQRWQSAGGGHRSDTGGTAGTGTDITRSAREVGGSGTLRLARPAAAQAVLAAYRDVFAPLFWYALLPGAIGPVLYLFARFAACHSYPFALTAYHWIDWIPLRLASIGLALAGRFEDAMFCLRAVGGVRVANEAARDPFLHQRVLLLPVAGGALGLRLTDPAVDSVLRTHAPDLDLPDADSQPLSLQPVVGLLLRSSILWAGLYLLVKVLD